MLSQCVRRPLLRRIVTVEVEEVVEAEEVVEEAVAEARTCHHQDLFPHFTLQLQHHTIQTSLSVICHSHLQEIGPKQKNF
jgi:hypothetical protein